MLVMEEEDDSPSKKPGKTVATPRHIDMVEAHVNIPVPSQTLDGVTLDPQTIRVKFDPPEKGKGRKEYMWVELSSANLEYLRMAVVNMGKHEGCDMSRKWHSGKHSKTKRGAGRKRRRLPSSDADDDDEEHQSDSDGSDASDVSDDDDESLSKRSFQALCRGGS